MIRWMATTLDGIVEGTRAVFEAKFVLPWSFSEEPAAKKHMAQTQHYMWVATAREAALSIITGGAKWVEIKLTAVRSDFLLAALRPERPYPFVTSGGREFLSKLLKALIDHQHRPLRALSREERELLIAANNGYLLAFDNLFGLPPWLSDALCRLATGGSFAVRPIAEVRPANHLFNTVQRNRTCGLKQHLPWSV